MRPLTEDGHTIFSDCCSTEKTQFESCLNARCVVALEKMVDILVVFVMAQEKYDQDLTWLNRAHSE